MAFNFVKQLFRPLKLEIVGKLFDLNKDLRKSDKHKGNGKWFTVSIIDPSLISSKKAKAGKGEIKLSFDEKVTANIEKILDTNNPAQNLDGKKIKIMIKG